MTPRYTSGGRANEGASKRHVVISAAPAHKVSPSSTGWAKDTARAPLGRKRQPSAWVHAVCCDAAYLRDAVYTVDVLP